MHHYALSLMQVWVFIILGLIMTGIILYATVKLMKYLDERKKISGKITVEKLWDTDTRNLREVKIKRT